MKTVISRGGLAATIASLCASAAFALPPGAERRIRDYIEASYPDSGPGVAIVVVENGKTVVSASRGYANLATKRKTSTDTVFRLASLTKQFTASVILQLEREGKLSVTDPVSKYLPDYPAPGSTATIAQLLNHTAGIRNFTEMREWMMSKGRTQPITTEQLLAVFKDEKPDFAPGVEHHYSNSGYVLLGAIIEKVTGRPWHEAVERRITGPLRLDTIKYGVAEPATPKMASGYSMDDGKIIAARPLHMSNPHAAGSLIGSIADFAKWNQALHHGKVLRPAEYARMVTPARLNDGSSEPYGFGLGLGELKGRKTLLHSGETAGFSSSTVYLPDDDLFVAVFTNSNYPAVSPMVARMKIAALAVGDPFPDLREVKVPQAHIDPLLGTYRLEGGDRQFFRRDGELFTRRAGSSDQRVYAAGNDRFFYGPSSLTWFTIRRDPDGKHVMTTYHGPGETAERSVRDGKLPTEAEATVPADVLASYVGAYTTAHGPARIALGDDGEFTLQVGKQSPIALVPLSAARFRLKTMDATVDFRTADGRVVGFTFNQGKRSIEASRDAQ